MADGMLEKYLKNEPLTEEIAALREGAEPAASMEPAPQSSELTEDEREHLRRMTLEPGWAVLQRMMKMQVARLEKSMMQQCADDPLGNRDKIAEGWAYVAAVRKASGDILGQVSAEIRMLDQENRLSAKRAQ